MPAAGRLAFTVTVLALAGTVSALVAGLGAPAASAQSPSCTQVFAFDFGAPSLRTFSGPSSASVTYDEEATFLSMGETELTVRDGQYEEVYESHYVWAGAFSTPIPVGSAGPETHAGTPGGIWSIQFESAPLLAGLEDGTLYFQVCW